MIYTTTELVSHLTNSLIRCVASNSVRKLRVSNGLVKIFFLSIYPVIHAIPSRARVNAALFFYPLSVIERPTAVKWSRGSRVLSRRRVIR
jgi:hypothetical protein